MYKFPLAGLAALSLTIITATPAAAFTITLNDQWYDVSFIEADFRAGFYPEPYSDVMVAQPWYGSEDLARSAAVQTADYFASQNFADLDDDFFACYGFCDRPFFVWSLFYEPSFVVETPVGIITGKSYLHALFATLNFADSNFASGVKPDVSTGKMVAGGGFFAIAEVTDAPPEEVPEPSALVGLTALGLLGLVSRKRS